MECTGNQRYIVELLNILKAEGNATVQASFQLVNCDCVKMWATILPNQQYSAIGTDVDPVGMVTFIDAQLKQIPFGAFTVSIGIGGGKIKTFSWMKSLSVKFNNIPADQVSVKPKSQALQGTTQAQKCDPATSQNTV